MFHRLLSWGWWFLYSRDESGAPSCDLDDPALEMPPLADLHERESTIGNLSTMDELFIQANETREILKRCERVRAKKAGQWLKSERMIPDLVQVIIGIGPNESYLHFLLKEHAEDTWSGQYGIQNLPLVQLAQPCKSPAVKVLDEYWQMQTTPPDVVLSVLTGLPGINMENETTMCFNMLLDMSSSVWRRQVRKHLQFPWSLAVLLDSAFPRQAKEQVLNDFFSLDECCLEVGAARPLKVKFAHQGLDCLMPGSGFIQVLLCLFSSKTTNVELENNFARSSSARSYVRGRRHNTSTMISKHILSELKHQHTIAMQVDKRSRDRKRKFSDVQTSRPAVDNQTRELTDVATSVDMSARCEGVTLSSGNIERKRAKLATDKVKVNGWSLCIRDCFSEPVIPGETVQERYKRLRQKARERQQNPNWKQFYSGQAKALNKESKQKRAEATNHPISRFGSASGLLGALQHQSSSGDAKVGPWGIGDMEFPIAQQHVTQQLMQPKFVRGQSASFRTEYGPLVDDVCDIAGNSVTHETFCMLLGGCYNRLQRDEQRNIMDVIRTLRDLARMHRGRKTSEPALLFY